MKQANGAISSLKTWRSKCRQATPNTTTIKRGTRGHLETFCTALMPLNDINLNFKFINLNEFLDLK